MKEKLKKFKSYSSTLLPFETDFLLKKLNSQDNEKLDILRRVNKHASDIDANHDFDVSIDKRKYSSLMHWMQEQLNRIDIDKKLDWITSVQKCILLDNIQPGDEERISQSLKYFKPSNYYFIHYYEMLGDYRHYLLIRMRYSEHARIDRFLNDYKFNYQRSRLVYEQMHQATVDIVGDKQEPSKSGIQWEKWMNECFDDDTLDGYNRYMSLVRLSFIYTRYNMLDKLEQLFEKANKLFKNGKYYSRRLLLNFYDNLVVLYDKKKDYEKARYFGYLSIRDINPDSIIYINNLVNVLLKMRSYDEAIEVLESVNFKVRESQNFHSMIGFVSNYVRALSKVGRTREAILKARVFLNAYDKQILKYRWYRFFSAYLGALLIDEKYNELLKCVSRYQLVDRETQYHTREKSGQVISIYNTIACFIKSQITAEAYATLTAEFLKDEKINNVLDEELLVLMKELGEEAMSQ